MSRGLQEQNSRSWTEIARTHWEYAALAANIYESRGESELMVSTFIASPIFDGEIAKQPPTLSALDEIENFAQTNSIRFPTPTGSVNISDLCRIDRFYDGNYLDRCAFLVPQLRSHHATREKKQELAAQVNDRNSREGQASTLAECDINKGNPRPLIPMDDVRKSWRLVREVDKYEFPPEPWYLFVPELAIDVWEKSTIAQGKERFEYAIVYRGTSGPGGWVSNLQLLTALSPRIWDQYRQVLPSTRKIIRNIYYLHLLRAQKVGRSAEVTFTAVGHSLGAGLAAYAYYRIPQISTVVGFNPSLIDGSRSLVSLDEREAVAQVRRPELDRPEWVRDLPSPLNLSTMFFLSERGEILGHLMSCHSGPIWGGEGGPRALCETIDVSRGNPLRQHDIRQLACKLSVLRSSSD